MVEGFTYIPNRFALGFAEAPRGDDIHWSMTGDNQKLYRWRCRAATYANWPTLRYMLRGNTVSDAPLIIGSLDPCYSCTRPHDGGGCAQEEKPGGAVQRA